MINEEILKKVIEKVIKNGFDLCKVLKTKIEYHMEYLTVRDNYLVDKDCGMLETAEHINAIIFSHSFAKAFWEEDGVVCHNCGEKVSRLVEWGYYCGKCRVHHKHHFTLRWQYHLQQMVVEEEPLKYLEKFL